MKTKPALAALYLLNLLPCAADTFTLKDGTTLEARILKEEADAYTLEVQVTKSIKDERKILKSDVVKVTREQLDLKAFEAIAKLTPTPDFLSADDYAGKINTVEKFIKDHRASSKVKEAQTMLATLKSESAQLAAGSVKIGGKMISTAEYQANAYDFDARVLEAKIRKLISEDQLLPALRAFAEFDRDFRTSLSYGALVPLAKQLIQSYINEAQQSLLVLDTRLKERQVGLERMTSEDRAGTAAAIAEEDAAIEARFKAEKEAKQSWVTTSPYHKASLEEAVKFGQTELTRISAVKTVLGVDGGKAYREVYSTVKNGGNSVAVTAALAAAKTAMVPVRYLAPLEAEAKGRK
jgi:hypothetical protein